MRIILTTALVSALALPGCGGSSGGSAYNPLNWFGKSRNETVAPEATNALIPQKSAFRRERAAPEGVAVAQILALAIEPAAGGAILRATGLSPTLGAYDVRLVPEFDLEVDGPLQTLEYSLKTEYSTRSRPAAPQRSRELTAAVFISDEDLEGVRKIRVTGAENARSVRR